MFSLFQESAGGGDGFLVPRTTNRCIGDDLNGENVSNTGPIDRTEVKRIQQDVKYNVLDRPLSESSEATTTKSSPKCRIDATKKASDAQWCQIVTKLKTGTDNVEMVPEKLVVQDTATSTSPEERKVRFSPAVTNISKPTQLAMLMDDIDAHTLQKRSSNSAARRAGLRKFKLKSIRQRELWFKELYWSRQDVDRMKVRASKKALSFRFSNQVAVNQIERLFDDFCRKSSEDNESSQGIDEEAEEMLNFFLHDWAASDGRGLEEMAAKTNIFEEGRIMAVGSILAYQQTLQSMDYSDEEVSLLLRARSESASRRARMFALYLALGDALVSAMDTESRRFVWISPTPII